MQPFDPYHRWLGIPPHEQPANLYRLLGISVFESDQDVIEEAAYRQIGHVKQYAAGQHRDAANKILNDLAKAQVILSDPAKKTRYDISIQDSVEDDAPASEDEMPPVIVQSPGGNRPGSFKTSGGTSQLAQGRRKRSNAPLVVIGGLASCIAVAIGFWLLRTLVVPPETKLVDKKTATAASTATEDAAESRVEPVDTAKRAAPVDVSRPVAVETVVDEKPADKLPVERQETKGHASAVNSVAFSPDGKLIVSASDDLTIKLWDAATNKVIRTLKGHESNVSAVAFSPDGQKIVSGSWDTKAILWDVQTGRRLQTFSEHKGPVYSVAYSHDGKRIASAAEDGIRIWPSKSGGAFTTLDGHSERTTGVAFSPKHRRMASGSFDKTVYLWRLDIRIDRPNIRLKGHSDRVTSVAFSPYGHYVVSGSWDKLAILWSEITGKKVRSFSGHRSPVLGVAFSPDGKLIATASGDKTVKIWGLRSKTALRTFRGHTDHVTSVAFSPDGKRVVSGSRDKTVRTWDLTSLGGKK